MLELTAHLDRKPANLSGGQRQRVAMGRAIVRSPKAFLMDEPLSNLDAKLRVQMRTQVARIQKTLGTTTLYVTHDQTEAMTLGDRVVVHARRHRAAGRVADRPLRAPDQPVRRRLHRQPGDELPAGDDRGRRRRAAALGEIPMPDRIRRAVERARAREVIIGIRPEHFEDAALVGDEPGATVDGADRPRRVDGLRRLRLLHRARRGALRRPRRPGQGHGPGHARRGHPGQRPARRRRERAAAAQKAKLWVDTEKMAIFDAETGANLAPGGEEQRRERSPARLIAGPPGPVPRRGRAPLAAAVRRYFVRRASAITSGFQSCSRNSR